MHVIGIDAGGSKTVALLADASGRIVGQGRAGGANLQVQGELEVEKVLHAVIDEATGDTGVRPLALCVGIAGVDRAGDSGVIHGVVRRLGFKSRALVVNDALIALVAGAADGCGLVLVSGTGSIAYGVNAAGAAARAGGWGHILGDEGAGYWIGCRALTAVMRQADGRGPATDLTAIVLERFSLARPQDLVATIYEGAQRRENIAALGPAVELARAGGDTVAAEILREAGAQLVAAGRSVVERLQMRGNVFPTLLAGGMFRASAWLAADVASRLADVAPRTTTSLLTVEPALGAVRLALAEARGTARIPQYIDATTSSVS